MSELSTQSKAEEILHHKNTQCVRFVDLFCGIGGFHVGVTAAGISKNKNTRCVWGCDIDRWAREAYAENFGIEPAGGCNHEMILADPPELKKKQTADAPVAAQDGDTVLTA